MTKSFLMFGVGGVLAEANAQVIRLTLMSKIRLGEEFTGPKLC